VIDRERLAGKEELISNLREKFSLQEKLYRIRQSSARELHDEIASGMSDLTIFTGLIEKELKHAKDIGAKILINGDVFDAIMPGDRKRYRANNLHPRMFQAGDDMIGESIRWAIEILQPYKDNILMIGDGNHDDAVARYHHIEPVKHLVIALNGPGAAKIKYGGYHGFIHIKMPVSEVTGKPRWSH
jgi:hypothetical protein